LSDNIIDHADELSYPAL